VERSALRALRMGSLCRPSLSPAVYAFRAKTGGADASRAMHAVVVNPNRLEIREPAALRLIHSVTDVVARLGSLVANFTALGHSRAILPCAAIVGKSEMLTTARNPRVAPKDGPP
jgi:hypothetical protein